MIVDGWTDERQEHSVALDLTVPLGKYTIGIGTKGKRKGLPVLESTSDLGHRLAVAIDAALAPPPGAGGGGGGDGGGILGGSTYEDDDTGDAVSPTEILDRGDLAALVEMNLGDFDASPPVERIDVASVEVGGDLIFRG
jgi:hypothetical protein